LFFGLKTINFIQLRVVLCSIISFIHKHTWCILNTHHSLKSHTHVKL